MRSFALVGLGLLLAACGGDSSEPWIASSPDTDVREAPAADPPPARTPTSAAACGTCHAAIHDEWKASLHGQAMTDEVFLTALEQTENREECIRCHAPVPLSEVDHDVPIARASSREEGVTCLTCHGVEDGVGGTHAGLEGACRPRRVAALASAVKMCFGCHNQHGTGDEWLNGPWSPHAPEPRLRPLLDCVDCHMPAVERPLVAGGPVRRGHRHTWPGGHDLETIRSAADVDVEVEPLESGGFRFRVWVTNLAAAHLLPTDARHRSYDTYVKLWDDQGRVLLDPLDWEDQARSRAATYRLFFRNSGIRSTQIAPLARVSGIEAEKGHVDVPEATRGRGEAWLVYRLTQEDALDGDGDASVPWRARVVRKRAFEYGPDPAR